MQRLKDEGNTVVLASSAKEDEVEHYLKLLDAHDLADAWTTSADVDSTKPKPDLVHVALQSAVGRASPSLWATRCSTRAAKRLDVPTLAVLTGGFSEQELSAAGAAEVFESPRALLEVIARTPLAA